MSEGLWHALWKCLQPLLEVHRVHSLQRHCKETAVLLPTEQQALHSYKFDMLV